MGMRSATGPLGVPVSVGQPAVSGRPAPAGQRQASGTAVEQRLGFSGRRPDVLDHELGPERPLPSIHLELHPHQLSRSVGLQAGGALAHAETDAAHPYTVDLDVAAQMRTIARGLDLVKVGADYQEPGLGIPAPEGSQGVERQGRVGSDVFPGEDGVTAERGNEIPGVEQERRVLLDGGPELVDICRPRE